MLAALRLLSAALHAVSGSLMSCYVTSAAIIPCKHSLPRLLHHEVLRRCPVLQASASAPALPDASPDAVQQLVAMGFDPARAAAALQQSHNDIQTALTYLL